MLHHGSDLWYGSVTGLPKFTSKTLLDGSSHISWDFAQMCNKFGRCPRHADDMLDFDDARACFKNEIATLWLCVGV